MKKLNKDARDLILSMAFGDGSINKYSGYLVVRHSVKQKEYIEWKLNLLRSYGIRTTDIYYVSNNGYGAYEFRTRTYDFIKEMRNYLYTPYKDIANLKHLNRIDELGLCIWYFDDGGLAQVKDKNGNIKSNTLMLNTMLTKDENQIIIDWFWNRWGIKFRQNKNHGKYRLECGTKEARKFIELIKPYSKQVPSMAYKLNVKKSKPILDNTSRVGNSISEVPSDL